MLTHDFFAKKLQKRLSHLLCRLKMASKRSGIVLVLVALASFVSALEFTQMSNEGNDVLGWTGGAQVDQPAVLPGPITETWVPSEDIADTLERMCRYKCLVSTTYCHTTCNASLDCLTFSVIYSLY